MLQYIYKIDATARKERIKKYADAFSLTPDLAQPVGTYSHGMKQKLAIIAALIHAPKLLIMDEPFVGLDPKAAYTIKEIMRELCAQGVAVFFSTHGLEVAEKLCNKVAIIKGGVLVAAGAMDEIVKEGETLESIFMEVVDDARTD